MPPATTLVIALDGPSGSGKSTVARAVAGRLGWRYVDTGATYRAATLAVLRSGADLADDEAIVRAVAAADITLSTDPAAGGARLDGEDVSAVIRGPEVTAAVSAVSAVPAVRRQLVALQRTLAGQAGAVLEGRDIGTSVFPEAPVKVFLDASAEVRAGRRAADGDSGVTVSQTVRNVGDRATDLAATELIAKVRADLARRDHLDSSRATSPLVAAADAVHLDSSAMDAAAVVEHVLRLAQDAGLVE